MQAVEQLEGGAVQLGELMQELGQTAHHSGQR
jgi:hypothetical protein